MLITTDTLTCTMDLSTTYGTDYLHIYTIKVQMTNMLRHMQITNTLTIDTQTLVRNNLMTMAHCTNNTQSGDTSTSNCTTTSLRVGKLCRRNFEHNGCV